MGAIKREDGSYRITRASRPKPRRPATVDERADWIERAIKAGQHRPVFIRQWLVDHVKTLSELSYNDVVNVLLTRPERFTRTRPGHWTLEDGA